MATLIDIARKTQRSISTVSVVLRGESKRFGICAETEQTIRRAPAYWFWSHKRWKIKKIEN